MKALWKSARSCRAARNIDLLERRSLLSAAVTAQIPVQSLDTSNGAQSIALSQFFDDSVVPAGDTVVNIETNLPAPDNSIPLILTDAATPRTVQNFLAYINSGEFMNTIVHRSVPGFVIQGGGYTTDGNSINSFGAIPSEASTEVLQNAMPGTIAMALSTGPDTATNNWFINLADNSVLDGSSDNGPFTVFGKTIYRGLNVALDIANLPIVNDTTNVAWSTLPAQNQTNGNTVSSIPSTDFVVTNPVIIPGNGLTYTATSSDASIVSASISGDTLSLSPVGAGGSAKVTVVATDLGGRTVKSTFVVNIVSHNPTAIVGKGANKSITYQDADGATAVVTISGAGTAAVTFDGTNIEQSTKKGVVDFTGTGLSIASIVTSGTTSASTLTITTKGGSNAISIGSITTDTLKAINAKTVTVAGDLQSSASVGAVSLASATGDELAAASIGSLKISGGFSDLLALSSAGVSLKTAQIGSITNAAWSVSGSAGSITVNGTASNWTPTFAGNVKSITIKGDLSGSVVGFTGGGSNLGKLSVKGSVENSTASGAGNLGAISAASLINSTLETGVSIEADTLPDTSAAFVVADTITSVKLKNNFSNSFILAEDLGTLSLGTLQTTGVPQNGVAATTIKSISATANKKFTLHNQTSASDVATELTRIGISLGDVVIDLVAITP